MIIVDTNVILAFLLTDGITRKIISAHKNVFTSPDFCFEELWKHRNIWNKNDLDDRKLEEIVEKVTRYFIASVEKRRYASNLKKAEEVIKDKNDAPILALALSIENEGIWTYNTKDFNLPEIKRYVRILTTGEVLKLYPIEQDG